MSNRKMTKERATDAAEQMIRRPTRKEAEKAVETLLRWAGDDTTRDGLHETPAPGHQGI